MGLFDPNVEKMIENKNVKGLIKALRHHHTFVRERAAQGLGEIGDVSAVEALVLSIDDIDVSVCKKSIQALGKISSRLAIEALIRMVGYECADDRRMFEVRREAIRALGNAGDDSAAESLIEALGDSATNYMAAEALGKLRGTRVVELLARALEGKDWRVREGAARALGSKRWKPANTQILYYLIAEGESDEIVKQGKSAVQPLLKALNDLEEHVRIKAARALGQIGDTKAVEPLIELLNDNDLSYMDKQVIIIALARLGDIRAVDPIINSLKKRGYFNYAEFGFALTELKDIRVVNFMIEQLHNVAG